GQRRDVGVRLLRHLGAARPRGAGAADQERPLQRGLPLHDGAGDLDWLWAAGREHGIRACGYRAIDALRIEKGYRVWGADMTPEETPDQAGLAFAVKPDKGDFKGREALLESRTREPGPRLCCLLLADARSVCLGSEPVRIGDRVVGRVTTGSYGYAVE